MARSTFVFSVATYPRVKIMVVRTARILPACAMMILLAGVWPAVCGAWSLLHPFSSDATAGTTPLQPVAQPVKTEPSALEKVGKGTKKFFNKAGVAMGLKKPEPKNLDYVRIVPPSIQPARKEEPKTGLAALFGPPEPKKPKDVSDWMMNPRVDDPH